MEIFLLHGGQGPDVEYGLLARDLAEGLVSWSSTDGQYFSYLINFYINTLVTVSSRRGELTYGHLQGREACQ